MEELFVLLVMTTAFTVIIFPRVRQRRIIKKYLQSKGFKVRSSREVLIDDGTNPFKRNEGTSSSVGISLFMNAQGGPAKYYHYRKIKVLTARNQPRLIWAKVHFSITGNGKVEYRPTI